jgi:hypothetical protein
MLFCSQLKTAVLFVCALTIAWGANASLVSYDEALNGNLGSSDPHKAFIFDTAGENTIRGTANWVDQDAFTFTIAPGFQLVGITVDVIGPLVSWNLYAGSNDSGILLGFFGDGNSDSQFLQSYYQQIDPAVLPLPASTYAVAPRLAISAAGGGYNSYTLNFVVAKTASLTVPEPGTLALFCVGLVMLVALRKRRQHEELG